MQVLVKNTFSSCGLESLDVVASFWDPECFYPGDDFSFSSLLDLSEPFGLSPFFFLDAKVAFFISALSPESAFLRGLGPLGTVAAFTRIEAGDSVEEAKKLEKYFKEYFPHPPHLFHGDSYRQVATFGESEIDEKLWDKLEVGGLYISASIGRPISIPKKPFEAFGRLWPYGFSTEFGWAFQEKNLGLEGLYFAKFKKLG